MAWFKLDDGFHHHPKVHKAGNAAVGLWVRCGTYSSHYLTDGYVDNGIAHDLGTQREIDRLIDTGMWVCNGSGFIIPDYLDYNPSAEQIQSERDLDRERKRAGGLARARTARRDEHGRMR